jgi:hypothetical protein
MICAPGRSAESWGMTIRLIKHEAVPRCGNYEVRFSDGRPPRYFYWDDLVGRRLRPDLLTGEQAEDHAKAFARAEQDKLD